MTLGGIHMSTDTLASMVDFDLLSLGADGQPGGEGEAADINSWE